MAEAENLDTEETVVRRHPWSTVAIVISLFYGIPMIFDVVTKDFLGVDFGVFHAGGTLIRNDGYSAAYDTERFTRVLEDDYFPLLADGTSVSHFISTPTFGWFAQVLTWLPFTPSLLVWLAVGFALLVPACRLLSLPSWVAGGLLISPMMAVNITLGQTGVLVLMLFVGLHRAHEHGRVVVAGALAGLIVLKPVLAFGYGLLWLIQMRTYRRSIVVAAATGAALSLPTVVSGLDPWEGFTGAMRERTDAESGWAQQAASVPEFVKLLFPLSPSWVTMLAWAAGIAVAVLILVAANRRNGNDAEMMSAAAVVATVIASPHLLIYDTLILVIPVAVAYKRGLLTGDRGGLLFALITVAFAFGPPVYRMQYDIFGRGIGIELPAVLIGVALAVRWDKGANTPSVDGEAPLAPILADA